MRVVKLSGTSSALRSAGPDACQQHWQVEEQIRGSGLPHVILRPNAFLQPLLTMMIAGLDRRTEQNAAKVLSPFRKIVAEPKRAGRPVKEVDPVYRDYQ